MSYNPEDFRPGGYEQQSARASFLNRSRLMKILLPLAILALAVLASAWMLSTPPQTRTRPVTRNALLVEAMGVVFGPQQTRIEAMGVVRASTKVELKPQVSGEVIAVADNFRPGGSFRRGERILTIDPTDYRLAVRQRESDVARTRAELQLEEGNQLIARKEFELLGAPVSPEEEALILRQPQLESRKAAFEAALASLEQAKLDLARTEITAPFNAVVQTRDVNLGTRVTTATPLATLVGTDSYWVEVSVPVSQLQWIHIPAMAGTPGARADIRDTTAWGAETFRSGEVIGRAAAVEELGRMATLLVRIPDPLSRQDNNRGKPALLLDTSVEVSIEGRPLEHATAIDRRHLHDGDTVWIFGADDKLEIRPVRVAFRERELVYVTDGIAPGEKLITSRLPAPVEGMRLRTDQDAAATPSTTANPTGQERRPAQP